FNILSGDMSIVGPRPALPREVLAYDERSRMRLSGKPGLTCTWQVSGRANLSFDEQVDLDIAYLDGRSFHRDIALIMRTIPAVLTARGAY
ncbi:sugar transferase, partial [Salmonella enterica]|uniref:sugar transferase n=1 Tax=Salmonella enterica TaxID=28901 RepID=UPI003D2D8553